MCMPISRKLILTVKAAKQSFTEEQIMQILQLYRVHHAYSVESHGQYAQKPFI